MSVLVTGGAGYIGSHTVRKLVERGDDVVVLDSLRTGHRAAVGDCPLVVGSVTDAALVAQVLADHAVTSVIHFAGLKNPGESIEHPVRYFRENVTGTLTLLDAMAGAGIETFVFSSSCSVYGTPSTLPVDEAAPLQPESPYGESKRMGEDLLTWFGRCHGIRSISLRYFNAAGAAADASIGETWEQTHNLIPLVIAAALGRRGPVKVFGTDYPTPDGTAIRDYVHVDDLADAHLLALDHLARWRRHDCGQPRVRNRLVRERGARSYGGGQRADRPARARTSSPRRPRRRLRRQHLRESSCSVGNPTTTWTRSSRRRGSGTRPIPTATRHPTDPADGLC